MSRRPTGAGELDLVPIMNLVSILIPFLLMASSFVSLAVVDVALPAIGPVDPESADEPGPLSIAITDRGFAVTGGGEPIEIGCALAGCPAPADYDVVALSRTLERLDALAPERDEVVLVPEEDVPFEVVVAVMDAAHGLPGRELFPSVVVAGGFGEP